MKLFSALTPAIIGLLIGSFVTNPISHLQVMAVTPMVTVEGWTDAPEHEYVVFQDNDRAETVAARRGFRTQLLRRAQRDGQDRMEIAQLRIVSVLPFVQKRLIDHLGGNIIPRS